MQRVVSGATRDSDSGRHHRGLTFVVQNQKLNLVHPRVSLRRQDWAAMGMVSKDRVGDHSF